MKLLFIGFCAAAVLLLAPCESSADVIYTHAGEWTGTIIEETPSHVQFELADGSIINIPKSEISRIVCTAGDEARKALDAAAELEQAAEDYSREDPEKAMQLYRRISLKAGSVRERAGSLYNEAQDVKARADAAADELAGNGAPESHPDSPREILEHKGISFTTDEFLKAARSGGLEVLKLFLDAGFDADSAGEDGRTALMEACRAGREAAVKKLLASGADVSLKDAGGLTALHGAMESKNVSIIQLIVDHTPLD